MGTLHTCVDIPITLDLGARIDRIVVIGRIVKIDVLETVQVAGIDLLTAIIAIVRTVEITLRIVDMIVTITNARINLNDPRIRRVLYTATKIAINLIFYAGRA